jgi:acetyl esterase/lipase
MTTSERLGKICIVCHEDVSHSKRIKDTKGNYYCEPCYAARKQAAKHPDPPAPETLSNELDLAPTPEPPKQRTIPCPGCKKPLSPGTVLCINCGYNLKLGKQATTALGATTESPKKTTAAISFLSFVPAEIFVTLGAIALFAIICVATPMFTSEINKVLGFSFVFIIILILGIGSNKCRRYLVDEQGWSETLFRIPVLRNFVFLAGLFSVPYLWLITLRYWAAAIVFTVAGFFMLAAFAKPDLERDRHEDGTPVAAPSQLSNSPDFVTPPAFTSAPSGIDVARLTCKGPESPRQLWIYRPKGTHAARSLPVIFIAPPRILLLYGSTLDDDLSEQYETYAKSQFIVAAYSLDGEPERTDGDAINSAVKAIKIYKGAGAGIANAKKAIDYVLQNVPEADPSRFYAVGGGSGGSVALCLAAVEPRISAAYAIAPITDYARSSSDVQADFEILQPQIPDIREFVRQVSPITHVAKMKCPVFLYQPGLDFQQTKTSVEIYWRALEKAGVEVRYALGSSDFESMKKEDTNPGLTWLKSLKSKPTAPKP